MLIARLVIGLLLFSAIVCFAFSIATGQRGWASSSSSGR